MRQALRAKAIQRQQIAKSTSYAAPVGGLNSRDALAAMPPTDAIALDNFFPHGTYVELRGGSDSYATAMTGNGKTLAVYNGLSGTSTMWCTTESGTYNVSSPGAVGASVAARTNGKHNWVNFGDGTNQWLIMCNGVDKPLYYNGSTWTAVDGASTPALTGVTTTNLIYPFMFKGRLCFLEKNQLCFWYLASGAAGGALTKFDLSGVAQKGGYIIAASSLTIDGGNGPDDRAVFVTSKGEVIVYVGNDPSSATTWSMVGRFVLGDPLGRRCLTKFGGDLLIINENGVLPLSTAIQSSIIDYKSSYSDKIQNTFNQDAISYGDNFGWCATVYPAQEALIINVPISEDSESRQYVMNTRTKAWCRFLEWDATDFAVFNGELFFVSGTVVKKAWTGTDDDGSNIEAYGKQAFNYLGSPGVSKQFEMYRPVLAINGPCQFLTDIDVDFKDDIIYGVATYGTYNSALWDTALWGTSLWGSGFEIAKEWTSPAEFTGYCASAKIKIATNSLVIQWIANDMVYQTGGIM